MLQGEHCSQSVTAPHNATRLKKQRLYFSRWRRQNQPKLPDKHVKESVGDQKTTPQNKVTSMLTRMQQDSCQSELEKNQQLRSNHR